MLSLQIVRAPLEQSEYKTILTEYNRLTGATIPMAEFLRWVKDSPDGPAWHALLRTELGRIVGHTSVLPLRATIGPVQLTTAMSEYSFVHEDFRKLKIKGYEEVSRPTFIILLDQLFQHCQNQGWGPLFASTNEKNQIFTRKVGLRPAEFPLKECLLVLRPTNAARHTPNLSSKQRAALFASGIAQKSYWSVAALFPFKTNGVRVVPIGTETISPEKDRLSFYEEKESLRWRYLADQYVLYTLDHVPNDYVIVKRGGHDRYVRVCQYRLSNSDSVRTIVRNLLLQAESDQAMGVRWAVYDDGPLSDEIVNRLQGMAFLCAKRVRIVMVHKNFPKFLQPSIWKMSDAHFCFDP